MLKVMTCLMSAVTSKWQRLLHNFIIISEITTIHKLVYILVSFVFLLLIVLFLHVFILQLTFTIFLISQKGSRIELELTSSATSKKMQQPFLNF